MFYNRYPYELPPLPYAYDALEPYIDEETMYYHHDKHFQAYVDHLNEALAPYPPLQAMSLTELLSRKDELPDVVRKQIMNNGGGVYNHTLFFQRMAPAGSGNHQPEGFLLNLINQTYGSYEQFKKAFSQKAMEVFGSGWTYLILTFDGKLKIKNFKNQETPAEAEGIPIIMLDVWEHAYYLKYKNEREDYISQFWNVVTFPAVEL